LAIVETNDGLTFDYAGLTRRSGTVDRTEMPKSLKPETGEEKGFEISSGSTAR
jgi:hypothetical protein